MSPETDPEKTPLAHHTPLQVYPPGPGHPLVDQQPDQKDKQPKQKKRSVPPEVKAAAIVVGGSVALTLTAVGVDALSDRINFIFPAREDVGKARASIHEVDESTPTDQPTPSPTSTQVIASPDTDTVGTLEAALNTALAQNAVLAEAVGNLQTAIAPTQELPEPPTATPNLLNEPWTGEAPFNQLRVGKEGEYQTAMAFFKNVRAKMEFLEGQGLSAPEDATDSYLTSMMNKYTGGGFHTDPLQESGLEVTSADMEGMEYKHIGFIFGNRNVALEIFRGVENSNGKYIITVWGNAHDRDAMTAYLSTMLLHFQGERQETNFFSKNMILGNMLDDPLRIKLIRQTQLLINSKTRYRELGVSGTEEGKWEAKDDWSSILDPELRIGDEVRICEVRRDPASTREEQKQNQHVVDHVDEGADTLEEANVGPEIFQYTLMVDSETGEWDVKSFTLRGYTGGVPEAPNQKDAVSANENLPCGEEEEVPEEPTPQDTPSPTASLPVTPTEEKKTPVRKTATLPSTTEAPPTPANTQPAPTVPTTEAPPTPANTQPAPLIINTPSGPVHVDQIAANDRGPKFTDNVLNINNPLVKGYKGVKVANFLQRLAKEALRIYGE